MENYTQTGFLASLFDLSFTRYVSVSLVRVLYILAIVMATVLVIVGVITGFSNSFSAGITALILAPIFFFLYVLFVRVMLEFIVVVFRIADYAREIAENTQNKESVE